MTVWTESVRVGLRPTRSEVWALRVVQAVERGVDARMRRRATRADLRARHDIALEERRAAAVAAWRGLKL